MVRKIKAKQVLRLHARSLSGRAIAGTLGVSRDSVAATLRAAADAGIGWADVESRSDDEVYAMLFPGRNEHGPVYRQPDWPLVHRELARTGVTLRLLHAEYREKCTADGVPAMGYDRFCKLYQSYVVANGITSRVERKAGSTIEVDWAGPTLTLSDPVTGGTATVYLFVACLPFSRYAFVEPALDMRESTWLACHVAMFEWFGGSTPRLVPDNLKTGVTSHPRQGEVVLNERYRALADHYSTAVLPGRVRRPKDKASVENTVWHVTMALVGAMRDRAFHSLQELREAIRSWLTVYNATPFQKREGARLSVFTEMERPLLTPLPPARFEVSEWSHERKVQANCHVAYRNNWYSAPYAYVGRSVDVRVTASRLEIWADGMRVSSHALLPGYVRNRYSTNPGDLPEKAKWKQWDRDGVTAWANRVGPACATVTARIFESVRFDEQGLGAALAVLRLSKDHTAARLETACRTALETTHSPRYRHLKPILDGKPGQTGGNPAAGSTQPAGFVRGGDYYGKAAAR